jgi:PPOX class probable F420-dependent enzyme
MVAIPESHLDLFTDPVVVAFATVQSDGQPQVTPIWIDLHEGKLRINTAAGRQKWKNLLERPQVTVLAIDPTNPYRWIEVRGTVVEHTEEGGDDVINQLSHKYTGGDYQGFVEGQVRVTFLIEPNRVVTN